MLNLTETAEYLGISREWLYEWIRLKKVPKPIMKIKGKQTSRFWTESQLKGYRLIDKEKKLRKDIKKLLDDKINKSSIAKMLGISRSKLYRNLPK